MVLEVTVFECESCGAQHESISKVTECCNCKGEVCRACEEEEDLCTECSILADEESPKESTQ